MNYRRGIAIGQHQVRSDSVFFRYHDKTWEFNAYDVVGKVANFNGIHYEAKVKNLDALQREQHGKG